jgi:hypothetical protein
LFPGIQQEEEMAKSSRKAKTKTRAKKFNPKKPTKVAINQKASLHDVAYNMCEHDAAELVLSKKKGLVGGKKKGLTPRNINWRICKSLDQLLSQINVLAPSRNKASDGGIGDIAHWKRGSASDHNPWVTEGANKGVVTARDYTHDPAHGCNCKILVGSLVAAKDSRIKYIIWDSTIYNSSAVGSVKAWSGRPYTGANKHNKHAHISVKSNKASYDNVSAWLIKVK